MQDVGIPSSDIQKLQNAGIFTVDGLARAPRRELEAVKGLSTAKVDKLLKEGEPWHHCKLGLSKQCLLRFYPRWYRLGLMLPKYLSQM
jgi:hypothetical protein